MIKKSVIFLFLLPLCLCVAQAQGAFVSVRKVKKAVAPPPFLFFENYGKKEGVPDAVRIHQDTKGFLWLGLKVGQGAARFDGSTFTLFAKTAPDALPFPGNSVYNWFTDRDGFLWLATDEGVFRQERSTGQFVKKPFAGKCRFISFFQAKNGRIWVGTESCGLAYLDTVRDSIVLYPGQGITNGYTNEFRPNNSFDAFPYIFETPDGLIWSVATIYSPDKPSRTMMVSINLDKHDIRYYPMQEEGAMDKASNIYQNYYYDPLSYGVWVGTVGGEMVRFSLKEHSYTVYSFEKNTSSKEVVLSVMPKDSNSLWIGTTEGVKIFDVKAGYYDAITTQQGQVYSLGTQGPCHAIFKDRDGNTWFVLEKTLSKLSPVRQQFPVNQLLPEGFEAQAMTTLPNTGDLLMASYNNNGVFTAYTGKPNMRKWHHSTTTVSSNCTVDCRVTTLLPQPDGQIWVGMNTGLGTLDAQTLRFKMIDQPIVGEKLNLRTSQLWVTNLLSEDSGDIWITTWNAGLVQYKASEGRFTSYLYTIPLFNPCLLTLEKDAKGRLLLGANGTGLEVWHPQNNAYQRYEPNAKEAGSITGRFVSGICRDDKNRIWIGTERGVCQFFPDLPNGQNFVPTATPNANTIKVINDKIGRLWLKTDKGLALYDPERNSSVLITEKQGFTIPSNDEQIPLFLDAEQQMWYGNRLRFDPAKWHNPPLRATPVLKGIKIHDQVYADFPLDGTTTLNLSHTDNSIRFEIAALDFDTPLGESRFKVKLDVMPYSLFSSIKPGQWIDLGTQNFATFANLLPGTYQFHYIAGNEISGWMQEQQACSFTFVIRPHWTNTWPFYLLLAAIAMGMLAGATAFYYRYRLRAQQLANEKQQREAERQRLELEKIAAVAVSERKAVESDMKLLRSQLNPHFLYNAMNSVNRYILANEKEKASEYLGQFARLTRTILDNSRHLTIPLNDELYMLEQYIALENHRFGQLITWTIDIDPDLDEESIAVPSMFLQPYIENAILHGLAPKGGGHIAVEIKENNGQLCCIVRDNGVGRNALPAEQAPAYGPKRASMGMKLINERLDAFAGLQGGQAEVVIRDLKNEEGQALGTEVEVRLPFIAHL